MDRFNICTGPERCEKRDRKDPVAYAVESDNCNLQGPSDMFIEARQRGGANRTRVNSATTMAENTQRRVDGACGHPDPLCELVERVGADGGWEVPAGEAGGVVGAGGDDGGAGGAVGELLGCGEGEVEELGCECAEVLAVGDEDDGSGCGGEVVDEGVGALLDVGGGFAGVVGGTVGEE